MRKSLGTLTRKWPPFRRGCRVAMLDRSCYKLIIAASATTNFNAVIVWLNSDSCSVLWAAATRPLFRLSTAGTDVALTGTSAAATGQGAGGPAWHDRCAGPPRSSRRLGPGARETRPSPGHRLEQVDRRPRSTAECCSPSLLAAESKTNPYSEGVWPHRTVVARTTVCKSLPANVFTDVFQSSEHERRHKLIHQNINYLWLLARYTNCSCFEI